VSLARTLDFAAAHPRAFGAPPATTAPYVAGDFNGEVARGASCNCRSVTLVPHCNGTHTESVAHLTREGLLLGDLVPLAPLPALLLSVSAEDAAASAETADPPPRPGDRVVTARAILAAWSAADPLPQPPAVLVLRTRITDEAEPPYLTLEAMRLLVARGIVHLVVELPSVDRGDDQGRLGAHRVFFGLPPGSTRLADAARPQATITELAQVPDACPDGACAVQLQLTAWSGDAVPSRPVWYAVAGGA
jgi:kynurenine formamidase